MGLFDIFRRKNKQVKSEADQSASKPASQAASTDNSASSQSTPVSTEKAESVAANAGAVEQPKTLTASEAGDTQTSAQSQSASQTAQSRVQNSQESAAVEADNSNPDSTDIDSASVSQSADSTSQPADSASDSTSAATPASATGETSTEERYDQGLEKSRHGFGARLNKFLANFRHVDEDFFDDLEDLLIESDVGYDMTMKLSDSLREEVKLQNAKSKQEVSNVIIQKMVEIYDEAGNGENNQVNFAKSGPTVIMFVGVNGAGKTTTIGKLAARYKKDGKKVLLAAADTFRAGAIEQLNVWAQRDGVDIVKGREHGDPAAVVFDAVKKAKEDNYDVLFVDTAGRLQNKTNLMNELAKMKRVLTREIPEAPHEVLLVLDATTGQNALNQAKLFKESTDVTGIVLTKLDGTARGGIVLAIRNELHLPVKFVGLGEQVDDLQEFNPADFVYGLFKGLVSEE